ncbi:MAG: hypothetical protein L0Z53_21050 [Acidobacteriales bacterium]|nr:hypothetical protein [Terriglobales bacterium]
MDAFGGTADLIDQRGNDADIGNLRGPRRLRGSHADNGFADLRSIIAMDQYLESGIRCAMPGLERFGTRLVLTLALLLLGLGALGYYGFVAGSGEDPINSLAILPFTNVSGDPNTEYLSDGLTESIINNLTHLPELRVIARNSAYRYKGKEDDPLNAGQALGVRAVVVGRLFQRGENITVSAELVDVREKQTALGATIQSQTCRCVRGARRDRKRDFREAALEAEWRRATAACEATHGEPQSFPVLHAGADVCPSSNPRRSACGHPLFREGH